MCIGLWRFFCFSFLFFKCNLGGHTNRRARVSSGFSDLKNRELAYFTWRCLIFSEPWRFSRKKSNSKSYFHCSLDSWFTCEVVPIGELWLQWFFKNGSLAYYTLWRCLMCIESWRGFYFIFIFSFLKCLVLLRQLLHLRDHIICELGFQLVPVILGNWELAYFTSRFLDVYWIVKVLLYFSFLFWLLGW